MGWQPQVGDDVVVVDRGRETLGRVIDDFGEMYDVAAGVTSVSGPARRWAIESSDGMLVFADTSDLRRALRD
ncbi:hypothetical protein ACXVUM_11635 [Williamsia sp. SKLECPSW1]